MTEKNDMEKVLEYAIHGIPQIKAEEKKKWLGEFRERVILGLSIEQASQIEASRYVEEALTDAMAHKLIINDEVPLESASKYMQLAKKQNKEFKVVATDAKKAMGLVVASTEAVDRQEVLGVIKEIPEKFKKVRHKELCNKCYQELQEAAPEYVEGFRRLTLIDWFLGIPCGICSKYEDGGPLM